MIQIEKIAVHTREILSRSCTVKKLINKESRAHACHIWPGRIYFHSLLKLELFLIHSHERRMFLFGRAIIFQQIDMEEFHQTQFSPLSIKLIDASFR